MFVSIARTTAPEGSPAPFWFRVTAINNGPDRWTGTIEVDLPHCCVGRSTHFSRSRSRDGRILEGRRRVRIRVTVRLFDGEGGSVKRRGA